MSDDAVISDLGLPDLITALRAELRQVEFQAASNPWFRYREVTLKVALAVTKRESGKLGLSVFGLGADASKAKDQSRVFEATIKLELLTDDDRGSSSTELQSSRYGIQGIASGGQGRPPGAGPQ